MQTSRNAKPARSLESSADPAVSSSWSGTEGPVSPSPTVPVREAFRRFWPWARPDAAWLAASVCLLVTGSFGEVVSVWLFKDLIDGVLVPRRFSAFWPLALAMLGTAVGAALLTYAGSYGASRVSERFVLRLRTATVAHLHTLPPDTLERRRHGDVVARLTRDVAAIEQLVASGLVEGGAALCGLLLFAAAAVYLSWPLALAALAAAPLFWAGAHFFGHHILVRERVAQRRAGGVTAVVEESLRNSALARTCNQEAHEVERVRREGKALMDAELATARVADLYSPFLNVLEVTAGVAVVGIGAFELERGSLSLGGLLAFAAFMAQLFEPAQQLSELASVVGAAGASAERVIELLDTRSPVHERPTAHHARSVVGRLSCENVRFGYSGDHEHPVLADVTFDIGPGQVLAVLGPSGCGKSTLAKLLVRFLDPDLGTVRLDGEDLTDLTLVSLRRAVTLLPQQVGLFHATIRDNIAYGRPDATQAEIERAAESADAHGFITALPDGYQSEIGRDGFQLSGGQGQRIAIARAFLRGTPVLVLDEPTAGLDDRSAENVIAPLRHLMAGRTTVLITHDRAFADTADFVLRLGPADGVRATPVHTAPVRAAPACATAAIGATALGYRSAG
ncbi:ABC transporter ATP-binding protein [Kitasatospora sp. NPDC056138]|uniref:ABC transporter ATP-binding protein n=1 Tax=Kitasatospora sp. NPDC056138 TaxID=3345724 RepID=UPI0035E33B24